MSCLKYADAIIDHAYGAPLSSAGAEHLAACEPCRRTFERHARHAHDIDETVLGAIAIEPSIDFRRGVRERIERTDAGRSRTRWWVALPVAAAIVMAVILGGLWEHSGSSPRAVVVMSQPLTATDVAKPSGTIAAVRPENAPAVSRTAGTTRRHDRMSRSHRAASPEAEVLVPGDQRRAIARLVELIQDGTLDPAKLPPPDVAAGKPADLVVPALTIEPIPIATVETNRRPDGGPGRR
ncbi:MAG: hypothetical protein DMF86_23185 [Acidobacteria bacterium]|nr:MAG: hypothetical protein DMF86_23185 [Acidobacteriota bacterium]